MFYSKTQEDTAILLRILQATEWQNSRGETTPEMSNKSVENCIPEMIVA